MSSIAGRPRSVTDEQIAIILEWHRTHKTMKQLAKELNLPVSTVQYVIAVKGEFKQASPDKRAAPRSTLSRKERTRTK